MKHSLNASERISIRLLIRAQVAAIGNAEEKRTTYPSWMKSSRWSSNVPSYWNRSWKELEIGAIGHITQCIQNIICPFFKDFFLLLRLILNFLTCPCPVLKYYIETSKAKSFRLFLKKMSSLHFKGALSENSKKNLFYWPFDNHKFLALWSPFLYYTCFERLKGFWDILRGMKVA